MMDYKNLTNFDELIELEHGKSGTLSRIEYEKRAQKFIEKEQLKEAKTRTIKSSK